MVPVHSGEAEDRSHSRVVGRDLNGSDRLGGKSRVQSVKNHGCYAKRFAFHRSLSLTAVLSLCRDSCSRYR